jgi:hypothetical protein
VRKSVYRFERRKHDQAVGLDRRKHDDDLAERIIGGVRTWSPKRREPDSAGERPQNRDDS